MNVMVAERMRDDQYAFYEVARRAFATIVCLWTPEGFPLVRDLMRFGADAKWKFVGGEGLSGETPEQGAMRETEEESGIVIPAGLLIPFGPPIMRYDRREQYNFDVFPFVGRLEKLPAGTILKRRADEGEEIMMETAFEIRRIADDLTNQSPWEQRSFVRFHYGVFRQYLQEFCSDAELLRRA